MVPFLVDKMGGKMLGLNSVIRNPPFTSFNVVDSELIFILVFRDGIEDLGKSIKAKWQNSPGMSILFAYNVIEL